jgi:DNA-binding transcriptional MerR regulator
MNNIKNEFSIKDLENLSGIKAHTIRIWEKRYNLLHPNRTDTNIRNYDLENLQKLLNVTFLNKNGYKISKISKLTEADITSHVNEIALKENTENHAINSLKVAMLNFDQGLFYDTYNKLREEKSFKEIVYEVFMPFLAELGTLWQTDTISIAHEHFVSTLIKQKILLNIEKIQNKEHRDTSKTFVLYLPMNEIHDIGLLFTTYELVSKGYHCIYLGPSVPITSLSALLNYHDNLNFVSYFTVKPEKDDVADYLKEFHDIILRSKKNELWILGRMLEHIDKSKLPKQIKAFSNIESLVKQL